MKKFFTRQERITYYEGLIKKIEEDLKYCKERLAYLQSDEYQDWNENVSNQVHNQALIQLAKKAAGK